MLISLLKRFWYIPTIAVLLLTNYLTYRNCVNNEDTLKTTQEKYTKLLKEHEQLLVTSTKKKVDKTITTKKPDGTVIVEKEKSSEETKVIDKTTDKNTSETVAKVTKQATVAKYSLGYMYDKTNNKQYVDVGYYLYPFPAEVTLGTTTDVNALTFGVRLRW